MHRGAIRTQVQNALSGLEFSAWWTTDPGATRSHLGGPQRPTWMHYRYRTLDSLDALQARGDVVLWIAVRDLFDPVNVALIETEHSRPDTWYLGRATIPVVRDRTYDRRTEEER